MSTAPHGPEWTAFLAAELGTDKWVVAMRLTDRLKAKGYLVAVNPATYNKLETAFLAQQTAAKIERIAAALGCSSRAVRAALTAENLI